MLYRKPQYYLLVIRNMVYGRLFTLYNQTLLKYWGVRIGKGVRFYGCIKVLNMNHIEIGDRSRITSGYSNMVGGECKTALYTGQQGRIVIGRNVGISNSTIISQIEIVIEDHVFIGGGCRIYDNDFHAIKFETRINDPLDIPSKAIRIGKGAFIGGHSIILKGVNIGQYAVIAAGSVVTKNIPENEIWGGVPAKKIKCL